MRFFENKISIFQLLICFVSIYVLGSILYSFYFDVPQELQKLLNYIDDFICILFLIDFFIRFFSAPNKLQFMKWGWIDLLSSIPNLDIFRAGRLFRLIRLIRLLRVLRSSKVLMDFVLAKKRLNSFSLASIFAGIILMFSSIAILQIESFAEGSNIKTAEDALWWSFSTITTVGYGDRFPVTTEGRIIGLILMTTGVGLFGVFTGFIASWFVEEKKIEP